MYLIVGAGLSGIVIAERLAKLKNEKVLIIDKRKHIGGNIYDYLDDNGILVHKYGPHAFHTNSKKVWDYLSQFTEWHYYSHRVKAIVDGKEVSLPFNLDSMQALFSPNFFNTLELKLVKRFGYGKRVTISNLKETDDNELNYLANYIYDKIYVGYTMKQWGLKPEDLDDSVTSRVPILINRDDRYFQDIYQGIPKNGYTAMAENMLNHENIEVSLNTAYDEVGKDKFKKIFYTGMIDEYFNFRFGELPYRSLSFDIRSFDQPYYQSCAQINYPTSYDFTRITEFKHFLDHKSDCSTIAIEYPQPFKNGVNVPYYPIPNEESRFLYKKYKEITDKEEGVIFLGRLADYQYYNMDQIVARALKIFEDNFVK